MFWDHLTLLFSVWQKKVWESQTSPGSILVCSTGDFSVQYRNSAANAALKQQESLWQPVIFFLFWFFHYASGNQYIPLDSGNKLGLST